MCALRLPSVLPVVRWCCLLAGFRLGMLDRSAQRWCRSQAGVRRRLPLPMTGAVRRRRCRLDIVFTVLLGDYRFPSARQARGATCALTGTACASHAHQVSELDVSSTARCWHPNASTVFLRLLRLKRELARCATVKIVSRRFRQQCWLAWQSVHWASTVSLRPTAAVARRHCGKLTAGCPAAEAVARRLT